MPNEALLACLTCMTTDPIDYSVRISVNPYVRMSIYRTSAVSVIPSRLGFYVLMRRISAAECYLCSILGKRSHRHRHPRAGARYVAW